MYIHPRKLTQNSFIVRFNGSLIRDVLDAMSFQTIQELRAESQSWMDDYNHNRPQESLGNLPPVTYSQLQPNLTSLNRPFSFQTVPVEGKSTIPMVTEVCELHQLGSLKASLSFSEAFPRQSHSIDNAHP